MRRGVGRCGGFVVAGGQGHGQHRSDNQGFAHHMKAPVLNEGDPMGIRGNQYSGYRNLSDAWV
ncbi:hypothetical protein BAV2592 [Bordetella avium 197N]|uniref:Uncharacterized protein n=1 Tax=Bordetella avium (strain 197N) TaxID=360910 RepID=Q2KWZ0_BORA1|nr:hypothetical protein BAV2592 [Bordetella avium 197N]